jgi:hypothetical protein
MKKGDDAFNSRDVASADCRPIAGIQEFDPGLYIPVIRGLASESVAARCRTHRCTNHMATIARKSETIKARLTSVSLSDAAPVVSLDSGLSGGGFRLDVQPRPARKI